MQDAVEMHKEGIWLVSPEPGERSVSELTYKESVIWAGVVAQ